MRIDEAAAIADLFGIPLDELLGRHTKRDTAMAYVLRGVMYAARRLAQQVTTDIDELDGSLADLDTIEVDGREKLEADARRAQAALREAQAALESAANFVLPAQPMPAVKLGKDLGVPEIRTTYVAPRQGTQ